MVPVPSQRWLRLAVGHSMEDRSRLQDLVQAARTYGSRALWVELHRGIASKSTERDVRLSSLQILKEIALESGNLMLFREAVEQLAELVSRQLGGSSQRSVCIGVDGCDSSVHG